MTSTSLKLKFGPNETFALLPQITAMIEKKKKKKNAPREINLKKKKTKFLLKTWVSIGSFRKFQRCPQPI